MIVQPFHSFHSKNSRKKTPTTPTQSDKPYITPPSSLHLTQPIRRMRRPRCPIPILRRPSRVNRRSPPLRRLQLHSFSVEVLLRLLRRAERVNVRPELDDFAEQVVGFALPVGESLGAVGVTGGVLEPHVRKTLEFDMWIRRGGLTASSMACLRSLCFANSDSTLFTYVVKALN